MLEKKSKCEITFLKLHWTFYQEKKKDIKLNDIIPKHKGQ